jgi:hypothetical protein
MKTISKVLKEILLGETRSVSKEEVIIDEISTIRRRIDEISSDFRDILGPAISEQLESRQQELGLGIEYAQEGFNEIEQIYNEFSTIREMLDKAFVEESNASFRIANEFKSLEESVKRITYELMYIKEERQKLRVKEKKEYPPLPMPELLSATESYNGAWTDLVGNARLGELTI